MVKKENTNRSKNQQMVLYKFKKFPYSKGNNKIKRHTAEQDKILASYSFNRGLWAYSNHLQ